ncbi:uncharacterized protein LOC109528182 [Hippocampus comes]|uniref:uncharacterized protein LOC109528182 n=1 Tax=Hippocampus comes TaxID=109280 RepID=UPI00094EF531|nr:PREDICTED: uncharacterized protein LOC109528182 [Hippocampus comes]
MGRRSLAKILTEMMGRRKETVRHLMGGQETVSLTTDIWTDRTMRSFLGVTAHLLAPHPKTQTYQLLSILLTCQKFKGRHTGEAIARSFDNVLEDFGIGNKVEFIVTDNASNMKRAFSLEFPEIDPSGAEGEEGAGVDDGDLWEDQDEEDAGAVRQALILASKHRIPCFAHTRQLVIGDGLKELRAVGQPIAKVSKLTTVLHRSAVLKERFQERFGVEQYQLRTPHAGALSFFNSELDRTYKELIVERLLKSARRWSSTTLFSHAKSGLNLLN